MATHDDNGLGVDEPTEQERDALERQAWRPVFRLIDRTDQTGGGSCVAIRIDEKIFLATAAHLIRESHDYEVVVRDRIDNPINPFAAIHVDSDSDVAALEVMETYQWLFAQECAQETCLLTEVPGDREWPVLVTGYPGECLTHIGDVSLPENENVLIVRVDGISVPTVSIPVAKWPKRGAEPTPDVARDLFLEYAPARQARLRRSNNAGVEAPLLDWDAPSMRGVSGGAVWLELVIRTPIWRPSPRLIGLQVSWNRDGGWLRATLSDCWLELVRRDYPALAKAISRIRTQRI